MRAFSGEGKHAQRLAELYRDDQIFRMLPSVDLEEQCEFRKRPQESALINHFAEIFQRPG